MSQRLAAYAQALPHEEWAADSAHRGAEIAGDSEDRVGRESRGRDVEAALGRLGRSRTARAANGRLRPRPGVGQRLYVDGADASSRCVSSAASAGDVWGAVLPQGPGGHRAGV